MDGKPELARRWLLDAFALADGTAPEWHVARRLLRE